MGKKHSSKDGPLDADSAKSAANKPSVKKPKKSSGKHPGFALAPKETIYPSDAVVLGCIQAQAGSAILNPMAQLGKLWVKGGILAGCINSQLGSNFKGKEFPPSMTVAECIYYVRDRVS